MKSHCDYKTHRLQKEEARKLISKILRHPHYVLFSKHAQEELGKDGLETSDAINVLTSADSKILRDGEFEKGSYRYRVETKKICVVVTFVSDIRLIVVTVWRK